MKQDTIKGMAGILVISESQDAFIALNEAFREGYRLEKASTLGAALEVLQDRRPDFYLLI